MRVHETMRMILPEFMEDWVRRLHFSKCNKNNTASALRFRDLALGAPTCHGKAIRYLISNSGDKERFKMLYSEEIRRTLFNLEIMSPAWWAIVDKHPPLEIKCIQGGGGRMTLDEKDTFKLPDSHKLVLHVSYVKHAKSILMGPGVRAGGDQGLSGRGCVYASVADWTRAEEDYVPEKLPFTKFRDELYWPRADWSMQVAINTDACKDA